MNAFCIFFCCCWKRRRTLNSWDQWKKYQAIGQRQCVAGLGSGPVLVHCDCCHQIIPSYRPGHKGQRPAPGRELRSSWRSEITKHNFEPREMMWSWCSSTSLLSPPGDCVQKGQTQHRASNRGWLLGGALGGNSSCATLTPSPSAHSSEAAELNPS